MREHVLLRVTTCYNVGTCRQQAATGGTCQRSVSALPIAISGPLIGLTAQQEGKRRSGPGQNSTGDSLMDGSDTDCTLASGSVHATPPNLKTQQIVQKAFIIRWSLGIHCNCNTALVN